MSSAVRGLPLLLWLIVASQLADLGTFLYAVRTVNIGDESNPLARLAYTDFGALGVVGIKVAATIALILIASRLLHRRRLILLVATAGTVAAYTNLMALAMA
jgi:hypothetical protein